MVAAFLGAFAVSFLIGVPVAYSLIASAWVYLVMSNQLDLTAITQKLTNGADSFPLLAIPFFILAADLMNASGVTDKIFQFANALVGRVPGGLGHANILASVVFSGMSGSSAADAAGLGMMEVEAMAKKGFDRPFSAAVTAASSVIGPIIPPSIPIVIYGSIAQASVGKLFLGGVIPGLLMAAAMAGVTYWRAVQRGYPRSDRMTVGEFWKIAREAALALLTPVILLGGIYGGLFTPTEAAVVAVFYAMLLGMVVYRRITPRDLYRILLNTVVNTAIVSFIIASAALFAWIMARERIPLQLTAWLLSISDNRYLMLLVFNLVFLALGLFMEINAIMVIFLPIVLPIVHALGIDLVHFGVVTVLNLMIGTLTPPFGMMMYVVTGISKAPMGQVIRELWPFIGILIVVLVLITYVPSIVMWLPNTMVQ